MAADEELAFEQQRIGDDGTDTTGTREPGPG